MERRLGNASLISMPLYRRNLVHRSLKSPWKKDDESASEATVFRVTDLPQAPQRRVSTGISVWVFLLAGLVFGYVTLW